MNQKSLIGIKKKHINNYSYLSLTSFPCENLKEIITENLLIKANKAQFLLGKLSGITTLLPNIDYFIKSFIIKDATSSSQIEGTQATIIEAFEYIAKSDLNSDADDIEHYVDALNYGLKRLNEDSFPFSLRFIKELHYNLMKDARSTHYSAPGEFRTSQNWIGGTTPSNALFVPPAPEELNEALKDIETFIHTPFIHPVIDAGLLHAQFETAHPFLDGNGRTGRLLIVFYLIHHGHLDLPALFLSSYFKQNRNEYYERLNNYHDSDVLPWLDFFLDGVIDVANQSIEVSKEITKLRDKDLEKLSIYSTKTSEVMLNVVKNLYKNPIASTATIESWTGQTRQGAIKVIDKLIECRILKLHKQSQGVHPAFYIHIEYVNIFSEK